MDDGYINGLMKIVIDHCKIIDILVSLVSTYAICERRFVRVVFILPLKRGCIWYYNLQQGL